MKPSDNLKKLVKYGIKAPSGHNTQPWLFSVEENENEIHIYPDYSRALPVVDSDNHALYISLGCAAENIVLAANHYKMQADVSISHKGNDFPFIKISLEHDDKIENDELFEFISERQSTRNKYSKKSISQDNLNLLKRSFEYRGIEMVIMTSRDEIDVLEPMIIEGSNRQFQNKKFVSELVDWIRFTQSEAQQKGDGVWSRSMGLPNVPRFIGNIVMNYFVSAKSEEKRWKKLIDATAGFALFIANQNDVPHWVRLGRAFQRFALTATKLSISHAHVNMPCEEPGVRQKLIEEFNLGSKHPLLLIRFGYSDKMPYSHRRNLDQVLI